MKDEGYSPVWSVLGLVRYLGIDKRVDVVVLVKPLHSKWHRVVWVHICRGE